jgi:hypothetical protein
MATNDASSELTIRQEAGYLHVRLPPYTDLKTYAACFETIAKACEDQGCTTLLVDVRETTAPIPVMDLYELGHHASRLAAGKPFRIALVNRPEASYPDKFFENVARNRGIDVTTFHTIADAEAWLR